jgi:hypothetical protein
MGSSEFARRALIELEAGESDAEFACLEVGLFVEHI